MHVDDLQLLFIHGIAKVNHDPISSFDVHSRNDFPSVQNWTKTTLSDWEKVSLDQCHKHRLEVVYQYSSREGAVAF